MATTHVNARVQKHREALRKAGLRPVQIWVPDARRPNFAAECRRQSRLAAQADRPGPHVSPSATGRVATFHKLSMVWRGLGCPA